VTGTLACWYTNAKHRPEQAAWELRRQWNNVKQEILMFINHLHSNILILACSISTQVPKMTGNLSHPHAHTAASPLFASSQPKCLSSSHRNDLLTDFTTVP
jgi:hypothetical protein